MKNMPLHRLVNILHIFCIFSAYFLHILHVEAVRGMRVDLISAMSLISVFLMDLKWIQTPHSLFWDSDFRADKTFTTRYSSPCQASGNHSRRPFQKTIEGLEGKINGQALGATLWHWHCLRWSDKHFRVCCSRCGPRPARLKKRY